jgi:hypothetical protein
VTPSAGVKCAKYGPLRTSNPPQPHRKIPSSLPITTRNFCVSFSKDLRARGFQETPIPRYDLRLGIPPADGHVSKKSSRNA